MSFLVHFDSRCSVSSGTPTQYQTTVQFPSEEIAKSFTKCQVFSTVIPQSCVNVPAGTTLQWKEPSGGGGSQVTKTITWPAGMWTLDSFIAQWPTLLAAGSGLTAPVFPISQVAYDAKIDFGVPTSSGTPVSAWEILWSDSPIIASLVGATDDTGLISTDYIPPNVYNFSSPGLYYIYCDLLPNASAPGSSFAYSYSVFTGSNSQMISPSSGDTMVLKLGKQLGRSQPVNVALYTDQGSLNGAMQLADLRGCNWSFDLLFS